MVFFDIEPVGEVPPHSHCAQWGLVIAGEIKLTIADETNIYKKGIIKTKTITVYREDS